MPFLSRDARIRRLQGSDATCCTTRRTLTSPVDATNCAGPSFLPESIRTQAMPSFEVVARVRGVVLGTASSNFTGVGATTKLLYLSSTTAVPLMTCGRDAGTREGCARNAMLPGAAA